tara:strand:+ start:609 stop:1157 length:549 start_codon:yes stop_codon:yes gene_type:complete
MILKRFVYKKIDSTNNLAAKIIKNYDHNSGIVITDYQKKGRGRYGKKWISYKGNIFVSIFFKFDNKYNIKKMTKINCKIIKKLLSNYINKTITIKNPNDLLVNKKKVSGILQEIIQKGRNKYMIVGIGINLVKSPKLVNYPTTNLKEITKKKISKKKIISKLIKMYEKLIPKLTSFSLSKII